MDPFIGQIMAVGFNFAPRGWALCDGQLLTISENVVLFSLLGTTYGGDGRTTFALPDLRGRVAIHAGNGPGLSSYNLGNKGGAENLTLMQSQMPRHNHSANLTFETTPITAIAIINAKDGKGDVNSANGNYLATGETKNGKNVFTVENGYSTTSDTIMNHESLKIEIAGGESKGSVIVDNVGANQPIPINQPYLALNYIICLNGEFPSRN